jgi:hypothetical protein
MAIHMNGKSSTQSEKSQKATTASASAPRWVVKVMSWDGRTGAWLGVLRNPPAARLTGDEANAVKAAFRPHSATFRFHIFWGDHALEKAAPGRAWYRLADVDGKEDVPECEAMIEAALASAGPKLKTQARQRQADAEAAQARKAKREERKAKPAPKAQPAKQAAKKAAIVL